MVKTADPLFLPFRDERVLEYLAREWDVYVGKNWNDPLWRHYHRRILFDEPRFTAVVRHGLEGRCFPPLNLVWINDRPQVHAFDWVIIHEFLHAYENELMDVIGITRYRIPLHAEETAFREAIRQHVNTRQIPRRGNTLFPETQIDAESTQVLRDAPYVLEFLKEAYPVLRR